MFSGGLNSIVEVPPIAQLLECLLQDWEGEEVEFETEGQLNAFSQEFDCLVDELFRYQAKMFEIPSLHRDLSNDGLSDQIALAFALSIRLQKYLGHFLEGLKWEALALKLLGVAS